MTYEQVKQDEAVRVYIDQADASLKALGFTEHSFQHVTRVAQTAGWILETLGYPERTVELVKIAGYLHDIGNVVNRVDHSQSGAVMAFRILDHMGFTPDEIGVIVSAIGNHDEGTAQPLNAITAALIIADKTDVRRSRVRNIECLAQDIHDRVNFAVEKSEIYFNEDKTELILDLTIDKRISSVMEYFEIFMQRMILCKKSAEFLGVEFHIRANGSDLV